MQEIIAALISFVLIEPVQAHIAEQYIDAGLSRQAATEIASCFSKAAPGVLDRASNEPLWAAYQVVGYWIGVSTAQEILLEVAPHCAVPIEQNAGLSV